MFSWCFFLKLEELKNGMEVSSEPWSIFKEKTDFREVGEEVNA